MNKQSNSLNKKLKGDSLRGAPSPSADSNNHSPRLEQDLSKLPFEFDSVTTEDIFNKARVFYYENYNIFLQEQADFQFECWRDRDL